MLGPLGLARPRIIQAASREKLLHPPSVDTIQRATARFAPDYDEWMAETHHPKATRLITKFYWGGQRGRTIAELGCGTAQLTRNLMSSILTREASARKLDHGEIEPTTFICLDQNENMLRLAYENIKEAIAAHIRGLEGVLCRKAGSDGTVGTPLPKTEEAQDRIVLTHRANTIVDVRFLLMEAERLPETEYHHKIDLAIMAYINHWLRGLAGKRAAIKNLHDTLADEGRVFVVEEYPLVVRTDLHPDDEEIQELGGLIEEASTVLTIPEISLLYEEAGFVLTERAKELPIDDLHFMHGLSFQKGVYDDVNGMMTAPPAVLKR